MERSINSAQKRVIELSSRRTRCSSVILTWFSLWIWKKRKNILSMIQWIVLKQLFGIVIRKKNLSALSPTFHSRLCSNDIERNNVCLMSVCLVNVSINGKARDNVKNKLRNDKKKLLCVIGVNEVVASSRGESLGDINFNSVQLHVDDFNGMLNAELYRMECNCVDWLISI